MITQGDFSARIEGKLILRSGHFLVSKKGHH